MITLNGLPARAVRLMIPAIGVWLADIEIDVDPMPGGRATLVIGTSSLVGTIDSSESGTFNGNTTIKLVGGSGGWSKNVRPLAFHNDAGVLTSAVYSATAAEVGETVTDLSPARLGPDFERHAGPASRVLEGRAWFVDLTGATVVGPRPPVVLSPLSQVREWFPTERRALIDSDEVILPGTLIADPRFGSAQVRDADHIFDANGGRVTAWCSTGATDDVPGSKLARAVQALARAASPLENVRAYRYRVQTQSPIDKRCNLQIVAKTTGAPEYIPLAPIWPGQPGAVPTLTPGTEVLVMLRDGNPAFPAIVAFGEGTESAIKDALSALKEAIAIVAGATSPPSTAAIAAQIVLFEAALLKGFS